MRNFNRPGIVLFGALCLLLAGITVSAAQPTAETPFRQGQVVVKADPDTLRAEGYNIVKVLPNAGLCVVQVPVGMEKGQVQALRARGKKAAPNRIAHKFVNDPVYSYQWHFPNVQAEQAWAITTGNGAIVAVLDSGLATGGEDGIGHVTNGIDIVNGDNDPYDGDGHGTHVSGTICQATNNNTGAAGLAYGASVMPVKVLDDSGSGSFADIADGIYWAVDHGAGVINMSLGIDAAYKVTNDPVVDPALDYAYAHNVTVCVASGNDGSRKNISYPAIYPTCIAVGATD